MVTSNDFQILRMLHQHHRTSIQLAHSKWFSHHVILKKTDLRNASPDTRRLAIQEAQLLVRLKHPNIIKCLETFEEGESVFIVMEYANFGDLSMVWKDGTMGYDMIMDVIVQALLALRYLHQLGIIHRDVKTKNILCSALGSSSLRVKLADFGVARLIGTSNNMASTMIGTPLYSSPEVFSGIPYDCKSDIWSLGCVAYELVAGVRPFASSDFYSLSMKVQHCSYQPLTKDVPFGLRDIIDSMLHPNPSKRPSADTILSHPYVREHCNRLYAYLQKLSTPSIMGDGLFDSKFSSLRAKLGTRGATETIVTLMAPDLEAEFRRAATEEELIAIAHKAWSSVHNTPTSTAESIGELTMTIKHFR